VSSSSSFQPISLERYQHALADADSFAAWLRDYQGHLEDVRGSLQGVLEGGGVLLKLVGW
jgi:hypothetical protein